jgi:hypothetical protein
MKKYKSSHRLPSGEFTKDDNAYIEAYEIIANSVLKYFPGYEWTGITKDCALEFANKETYSDDRIDFVNHFILPLEACRSLIWGKVPDRIRRFDL